MKSGRSLHRPLPNHQLRRWNAIAYPWAARSGLSSATRLDVWGYAPPDSSHQLKHDRCERLRAQAYQHFSEAGGDP
jgi:hypothetical protein